MDVSDSSTVNDMMKFKIIFSLLIVSTVIGCTKPGNENETPDPIIETEDDDGQPHPSGSFDYSAIAPHPRLLLSTQDEASLQARLQSDNDLLAVHEALITQCNAMMNTSPVTRVLDGKRLLSVSRTALKRIFFLSYAYRMTGENRYLVRAERELNAVCDFSDWNPSHFLDVGEMATGVAIGYDWLYNELSPETRNKIRVALLDKAFSPSKIDQYNWYLQRSNNWNQVCNAGLVFAALATYEANKEASVQYIEQTMENIALPLNEYAPHGNYPEGYMYWAYGTSFQVMLLAALESALGTDQGLHEREGFLNTAEYMLYMVGPSGLCFNYADSYSNSTVNPALFWLANKQNDPSLLYNEMKLIQGGGAYARSFPEDRLLPTALIYASKINRERVTAPTKKMWVGHGTTPVALIRTGWDHHADKYVGIKGGEAAAEHGHMDAGSFVFESEGERWAIDLGYQEYLSLESKGIDLWNMGQNSQRWDVFRLGYQSHNVLSVDGKRHVVNGKADIVEVFDTDAKRGAVLDLTEVFHGQLQSARREVALINEDYLSITDRVTTNYLGAPIRWAMATSASPEIIDERTIRLTQNGKVLLLKIEGTHPVVLNTWSTTPTTDFDAENPGTIMVGFESSLPADETHEFTITLKH